MKVKELWSLMFALLALMIVIPAVINALAPYLWVIGIIFLLSTSGLLIRRVMRAWRISRGL